MVSNIISPQKTKEDIKREVDEEWIPGTVVLVDTKHLLQVQHENNGDIVLIPQPSENPNDPLLWGKWKKEFQFIILWYWSFLTAVATNWNGPVWSIWVDTFNTTFDVLNNTSALCWCFLGVGCLILQPTAMTLGRRCVYLFATIVQTLGNVVGGVSKNVGMLYGVNIMTGFAGAPCDSLVQISTTDIFFQHERATRISALTFALYSGSYLGPIAAGYIVENNSLGWRWCYWFLVIFFGSLFAIQFFLMEDSTFVGQRKNETETEKDILAQVKSNEGNVHIEIDSDDKNQIALDVEEADQNSTIPLKRTYLQKLKVMEFEYNDKRAWWKIFLRPSLTLALPAITWGGFVYGVQVMWLSLIATTQSEFFSVEPYNFSPSAVGNTNFASLIGCFFGMIWGGPLSDKFVAWKARKNNGILEPEFRLWFLILPAFVNSAGLLLYGLGMNSGVSWIGPAGFGMGFLGFGMGSGGAIVLTYALDCYPELQSESMVMMLFLRNMIGMGFTFAIQPWLNKDGIVTTTWLMFMLSVVFNMSCLIFIKWGKLWRQKSKNYYLKCSDPNFFL
jgi:hypothetical protein